MRLGPCLLASSHVSVCPLHTYTLQSEGALPSPIRLTPGTTFPFEATSSPVLPVLAPSPVPSLASETKQLEKGVLKELMAC